MSDLLWEVLKDFLITVEEGNIDSENTEIMLEQLLVFMNMPQVILGGGG